MVFFPGADNNLDMISGNKNIQVGKDLYYFKSEGDSKVIGLAYGKAFRNELESAVISSEKSLKTRFSHKSIESSIHQMCITFKNTFPYLWDELIGLSEGSEIPLHKLQEYVFAAGIGSLCNINGGCTDIIFPDSDKGPLLGKTHDATSSISGPAVVRLIRHHSLNTAICITRIDGFSAMTGLNDKGLAVGEASVHFYSVNTSGIIRNLLLRPLLHECDNVKEAVKFLNDHPPLSAGFHFALVDQSGNAAVVERSPKEQSVRWSSGEIIFCTNHTVTPYMRIQEKSRGKEGDRNSDMRYDNLIKLTQKDNFRKTLDTMKDILKYHDTFGGICQHGDPSYQGEKQLFYPMVTIRAFINIIKERKLLIANGNPCINDYFEFQFE